jgi:predicted DCC family thiol-disulfide oxidoreductase YuxK
MADGFEQTLAFHDRSALCIETILLDMQPNASARSNSVAARGQTEAPAHAILSQVPTVAQPTEILFYDGHCGLCHRAVKFVLKRDRTGAAFRFAPLQGSTFLEKVPIERRAGLPDSVIVLTGEGELLARSDAFLHICRRLGGRWRWMAGVLSIVPRGLRDAVYNFVARVRYRVFGRRDDLCPIVPADLRERFLN